MNRFATLAVTAMALAVAAPPAQAGLGVGAKAGTLGLGLEFTRSLGPRVNARVGINYYDGYEYTTTEDGIDYTAEFGLFSASLLGDFHPVPLLGLRASAGVLFNGNSLELVGAPAEATVEIGGETYTTTEVGEVRGEVGFGSFAPYAGIGWGNASSSLVAISIDVGIVFQGAPEVELSATGPIAENELFREELIQEQENLAESIENFKFYPVVSLGLSFKLPML